MSDVAQRPDLSDDLAELADAAAVEALGIELPEEREQWAVTDEGSADWALARIRHARSQARARTAPARRTIQALQARIDGLRESVSKIERAAQREADFFEAKLIDWHRQVLAGDRKATSIVLGNGALRSRMGQPHVEVIDLEALPEEFVVREPRPHKRALLAHVKSTGELPPGVSLRPAERHFTVEC